MSEEAARNRVIKKVLEAEYGKGKVGVTGGRGTAYGNIYIDIETSLFSGQQSRYQQVIAKLRDASIEPLGIVLVHEHDELPRRRA